MSYGRDNVIVSHYSSVPKAITLTAPEVNAAESDTFNTLLAAADKTPNCPSCIGRVEYPTCDGATGAATGKYTRCKNGKTAAASVNEIVKIPAAANDASPDTSIK